EQPFFAALIGGAGSTPVRRASEQLRAQLARHVELLIAHKRISRGRREQVAAAVVDILGALLPRALEAEGRHRRAVLGELKLALTAHLGAVGGAASPGSVKTP